MPKRLAAAGVVVVSLDSTVNIAFPAMAAAFGAPPEQMRWVIICYVLTYALTSFAGGAAGDRLGHGRVFRLGVAVSAAGFALCGTAPTFAWLLAGRFVQGVGGGLVYGTAPALVVLDVPSAARGRALGLLNAAIGLALSVGPLLAGAVVERLGWASVFQLRLPLALGLLGWATVSLPAARLSSTAPRIGLGDITRAPVIKKGLLAFLAQGGIFAVWLLSPFFLMQHRRLDALTAGVLFMLTPLGTTVAAPLAGRLADRAGPCWPMTAGLALEATGLLALAGADATTPAAALGGALFAAGFGLGVFQTPNMVALMAEFPAGQQGAAGGFAFLARTLGTVGGVALLAEVFATLRAAAGAEAAYAGAFALAAALPGAAAVAVGAVRRRR